ncbi:hypothetical protein BDR07DRAFT_1452365 [Suillus spraguei]|nr:hypothetical protein BDR07DRAFT_1452365 [Suillus spraguei]
MMETRGLGRGSYIWGCGFGAKWKDFFQSLEAHDGLNPDLDSHMWLLHHLFLDAINEDAIEWAEAWNNHVMSIRGDRHSSPHDMFFFRMLENGIDWESINDCRLIDHHHANNEEDELGRNHFVTHHPQQFSEVMVPEADSPLSFEQVHFLGIQLEALIPVHSHSMESRHLIWSTALQICRHFYIHEDGVL